MIDVSPHDLETIKRILAARVPGFEARAYGSRYRWTAKDYSDLDLVVVGKRPPTLSEMANLRADFEDSDLPFRVDVLDWHSISPEFRRVIEDGYEIIQSSHRNRGTSTWETINLEDALENLIDYRGKTPTKRSAGIPLITAKIIKNGFIQEPDEFIDERDYESWMTRGFPKVGDVILTTEAPLGEVAQLRESHVALAQRVVTLRGKEGVLENSYLKYFLQSDVGQSRLKEKESGTTVTGIKQSELRVVKIDLPPFWIQQQIGQILGTLDDKIELNRRMNETLEAIARAIFKSWFVDFDPVRAKAQGRQPVGMDAETAALFPDSFEDSELGEIPRGWGVVRLPEIIKVNPNRPLKKNDVAPYLDMANMPTRGHRAIQWIDRPYGSGTRFENGDTLLARITPCLENGKTSFVDFLSEGQVGWGSTEYIILHPKSPLPAEYGYFLARGEELRNYTIQNMTGTSGRQRAPASCLNSYLLVVPSERVARHFGEIVRPMMQAIRASDEQSRTLAEIRDALLPKLISGEVQLENTDNFVLNS